MYLFYTSIATVIRISWSWTC